ncbi:MAG: M56 family metallopeptidase [Acidobacteriaceae bacterium]|nr:M56 family metallopeptidase [Acidobacteriaceae bacterium]
MMPLEQAAGLVAERLLNGIPAGIVIALAAWILLRLVARRNSSTRFAVWFLALLAIGAAPLIGSLSLDAAGVGRAAFTVPSVWGEGLLALWGLIAGLALLRVGVGLWGLQKLRKRHQAMDIRLLDPLVQRTVSEFELSRKVTLAISDELRVPTAIGFFRPMILLPKWALTELPAEELSAILIHELAHLKRWDDCTNLAQKILRSIFFFNPAICWIENRLSLEREMACDDVVLSRTQDPALYARSLVAVAEKSFVRRGIALAQAAVGRMRQTSHRVAQILDGNRPGATRMWKPALAIITVFSVASMVTLMRVPELISFQPAAEHAAPMMAANLAPVAPAMLVPASFHPTMAQALIPQRTQRIPRLKTRQARRKLTSPKARVVLASTVGRHDITTRSVVIIWQERDGAEMPLWTVCIWRVTFVNSRPAVVPARST